MGIAHYLHLALGAISDGQWAMVGMVAEQRKAISLPSCQLGESQLCFALSKV